MKYILTENWPLLSKKSSISELDLHVVPGYRALFVHSLITSWPNLKVGEVNLPWIGITVPTGGHSHWLKLCVVKLFVMLSVTPLHWLILQGERGIFFVVFIVFDPFFTFVRLFITISKYLSVLLRSIPVIPIAIIKFLVGSVFNYE